MYDRAILRHDILNILNKSPATPGFYTPDKCNMAIQKSLDMAATEMMIYDGGFLKKLDFLDVQPNQLTIPVPPHMEFIQKLSYLVGNVYSPLAYDSRWDSWNGVRTAVQRLCRSPIGSSTTSSISIRRLALVAQSFCKWNTCLSRRSCAMMRSNLILSSRAARSTGLLSTPRHSSRPCTAWAIQPVFRGRLKKRPGTTK